MKLIPALALVAFGATTFVSAPAQAAPSIQWQPTFESALAAAKRTKKPIMVDFYATWCGPCKLLDSKVYSNAKVVAASRSWINVKVDGEKRADLMKKYGVTGFPTVAFLYPTGKVSKMQAGLAIPREAQNDMNKSIAYLVKDMVSTLNSQRVKIKK